MAELCKPKGLGRSGWAGLCLMALSCGHVAQAQVQQQSASLFSMPQDMTVVLGTKLWSNTWSSWTVSNSAYNLASRQVVVPVESGSAMSVIPQMTVLYKDWAVSTSMMKSTSYTMDEQWQSGIKASRSEFDVNAGYVVTPGMTATVGYKKLVQNFGGRFTWAGPTVGLSASAPIHGGLSLYGALGLGALSAKLPNADAAGKKSLKAGYVLSEAGLAYSVQEWKPQLLRSLVFTAGYRGQTMTTHDYSLLDTNLPNKMIKRDVKDTTQGLTLGLVVAF